MLSASGIGSGLDIGGLVEQLVAAERAPQSLRLNRIETGAKARLSALASVASAFDRLSGALKTLSAPDLFSRRSAASSAENVFVASASAAAAPGRYEVEVLALASAHKLTSTAFAEDQALGAGRLEFVAGGIVFAVDVEAGADTPSAIAEAVNAAAKAAGSGVRASTVRSDDGLHLVFNAAATGADQAIRVSRVSGSAGLDALVFDPGVLESLTERVPAADARVRIDGLTRSAPNNRITDAVDGLVLELRAAEPGVVHRLDVGRDDKAARDAVQAMVTAYNGAVAAMAEATRYDPQSRQAAALNGDSLLRGTAQRLRGALGDALGQAAAAGLDAGRLGLSTRTDGTLSFDGNAFQAALAADPDSVTAAFVGEGGLAGRLTSAVSGLIGDQGVLASRQTGLNRRIAEVSIQREALDRRMEEVRLRFETQFIALDSLIAQLQSTGDFLTRQFAGFQG